MNKQVYLLKFSIKCNINNVFYESLLEYDIKKIGRVVKIVEKQQLESKLSNRKEYVVNAIHKIEINANNEIWNLQDLHFLLPCSCYNLSKN